MLHRPAQTIRHLDDIDKRSQNVANNLMTVVIINGKLVFIFVFWMQGSLESEVTLITALV